MFTTQITPRISETNMGGHISNTVLPVWFEAGRAEIYAMFHADEHLAGTPLAIKTFTVTFHREMELHGEVRIESHVARIGRTSFALTERALQHGQVCATGEVVYVVVGPDGPEAVPDAIRDQLNAHQISESAPEH
ncbi:acyl-CoA thioesterase [Micrococcus terreus]|uniref:acyl-CoA thioesterase n=1 Tax=Micrococcus terreus TaxID=574650 RepID=UPI0021A5512F|nr:thioesterase family protein [Micrococcus terreus]MCT2089258.1 acyl-CoA thioesterase [Micrococcus terreus]MDK7701691.1 thioesterase family protein [Micrococcus terreus]WOO97562.1 thioesterase family protein [Micrococcus terreus]